MGEVCYSLLDGHPDRRMLDALRSAIAEATSIEIAVSFVKRSGLALIMSDLILALESGRCKHLSFLTSDYMHITDPLALRELMLLSDMGADIRVHEVLPGQSFHLKAYLFLESDGGDWRRAEAFVGSSNLSRPALTDGLEWNYRLRWPDETDASAQSKISEIRQRFGERFEDEQVRPLTFDWIEAYKVRRSKTPVQFLQPEPEELDGQSPEPRDHQLKVLNALSVTRREGCKRGLVVLATGLGKTWLAAFDVKQMDAKRILFVAHREEILNHAEHSFLQVLPELRSGRYSGKEKDADADILFASVQTLGREVHLSKFAPDAFDYIVVDEFHHAAAASYQRLLGYFEPDFMLGLTATPDRGDRYDILQLCGNNLVYQMDLFEGIRGDYLVPFHYYGIFDKDVDYTHIPWRSGRFDPNVLTAKLATTRRARHAFQEWKARAASRTLAFCSSRQHADFMAEQFRKAGVSAGSVYAGSVLGRETALEKLASGELSVLFAVDLFNEGMDLPAIDTVMMLRPTESSILFLQQLGRGLRLAPEKTHLVVLDFVANHKSFLNRPELLSESRGLTRNEKVRGVARGEQLLPDGCFVNYDLEFIEFLKEASSQPLERAYFDLKEKLGKRPDLTAFWQDQPDSIGRMRTLYGSWWAFLDQLGELSPEEAETQGLYDAWFRDLTVTSLSKCFKLVLLHTWLEREEVGAIALDDLAADARAWFCAHPDWQTELAASVMPIEDTPAGRWRTYWTTNPVKAWSRPERSSGQAWFSKQDGEFVFHGDLDVELAATWRVMTREVLDWRLTRYASERLVPEKPNEIANSSQGQLVPFFPSLQIACGHFRSSEQGEAELVSLRDGFGRLDPERHFVARAVGNSMNGGKSPVLDGDLLLLEMITSESAGRISDQVVAVERQDIAGDDQYLLRRVIKQGPGAYILRAFNPDYEDMAATDEMATFARLKAVLSEDDFSG